jgi:hypothetical protein
VRIESKDRGIPSESGAGGATVTNFCRGSRLIHSSMSETIDTLCWNLGLIFTGAYADAEDTWWTLERCSSTSYSPTSPMLSPR